MIRKAVFAEKQEPVTVTVLPNGEKQYQLCVHEALISPTEEEENGGYEYDFVEFIEDEKYLKEADVREVPENYLSYTPVDKHPSESNPSSSIRAEIDQIKATQEIISDALQDLTIALLGGE